MSPQLQSMLQQAIQAFQGKNFDRADSILKRVLQVEPKNFLALNVLGLIKASQANYTEAANFLERAARISPNDASIQFNLAKALTDSGNNKDAIVHHKKSVSLAPNNPEAWLSYGITVSNLGRYEDALVFFGNALSLKSDYLEALLNKSNALYALKHYHEAMANYDKVLSLKPDYAVAWSNKGMLLSILKRFDEAINHYDQALALEPDLVDSWFNKGNALNELKRYEEAIAHFDKALSLKPDYAEAWSNKGTTLNELKQYDEAIAHYDQALALKPDLDWVYGDLLHAKMKICKWSDLSDSLDIIHKRVMANERVVNPLILLTLIDDALLHKKSSEIYIQPRYPLNPTLGPISKHPKKEKIRIGYFSADFRNHAVSILTAELFELHDKNRFEITAFSFGVDDKSLMRLRLSEAFNQFIDVSDMSDLEIAKLSRNLQIDIAVDLGGYTANSRTGIFSHLAAPIQTGYIGYLGTMGAEYYDYLFADEITIPVESQKFYSEKIAYLPSYQANDRKRIISEGEFIRRDLGLPETGFVFCCFNHNFKILPSIFDGWMRILNAVEGSAFFLLADNEWSKANLIHEAALRGVDSTRLIFGGRIPSEEYLARYRVCDLFLDTFPYNAGTTASDALWAGLPVLTLIGQSFASRIAASLLKAIGLSELITNSQEQYEALAIELAMNPKKLADIKLKLANNRLTTPLFDTPLFTKNLEAAYIRMYEESQIGL